MENEKGNTNEAILGLIERIGKRMDSLDKRTESIEAKEKTPVEVRLLNLEGRMLALENLLTEETPTGKQKLNKLGRGIKVQRRF